MTTTISIGSTSIIFFPFFFGWKNMELIRMLCVYGGKT